MTPEMMVAYNNFQIWYWTRQNSSDVVEDGAFEGDSSVTKKNRPFGVFFCRWIYRNSWGDEKNEVFFGQRRTGSPVGVDEKAMTGIYEQGEMKDLSIRDVTEW
jgi:hypothetical protein